MKIAGMALLVVGVITSQWPATPSEVQNEEKKGSFLGIVALMTAGMFASLAGALISRYR